MYIFKRYQWFAISVYQNYSLFHSWPHVHIKIRIMWTSEVFSFLNHIYRLHYVLIQRSYHDVRLARISLTLSLHVSLSFIAFGRSSGLHPVSSHSCCMNVRAGRPAFDRPYVGVHRSTSLTISSLLLQQCPACLVRLTWIVFVVGGRTVGAVWGVAARTWSILLAAFLYNCRRASSPTV